MNPKTVTYHKVFSLGNYENEKIGVEIELQPGDDPQIAIQQARNFVEFNHKVNGLISKKSEAEHVINNPDNFTGRQVTQAREIIDRINEEISKGEKALLTPAGNNPPEIPVSPSFDNLPSW